jgi:hypothetical protein
MFNEEERTFVLPRKRGDRFIVFVFSCVLTGFFALMHSKLDHATVSGRLQEVLHALAIETMFVFCIFSFLALVWALFMPRWLESMMSQTVRKVLFIIAVVLIATAFTILYYTT